MANKSYTVAVAKHPVIDAGAIDTVTLTGFSWLGSRSVEVFNHGTGTDLVWFTTDGSDPVPWGDDNYFARPGLGLVAPLRYTSTGTNAIVKVYCAASVRYSITGT